MIKLADGDRQGGGLVNASGQLVTIRANDQAFRKLKEVGGLCYVGYIDGAGGRKEQAERRNRGSETSERWGFRGDRQIDAGGERRRERARELHVSKYTPPPPPPPPPSCSTRHPASGSSIDTG